MKCNIWLLGETLGTWGHSVQVQSLSRVRLFATSWIAARQASLSITSSQSLLKLMPIESVMPSSHLILCRTYLYSNLGSLEMTGIQTIKIKQCLSFALKKKKEKKCERDYPGYNYINISNYGLFSLLLSRLYIILLYWLDNRFFWKRKCPLPQIFISFKSSLQMVFKICTNIALTCSV